ncbi:MAG: AraC family transcriptional regulator [Bacteroidota bacterium]|nr:AraC family transcriptional regulator [Bacteroidota bacterium]
MQKLQDGRYLGGNIFESRINGLIISQSSYQQNYCSSWHYHENSYFAFILKGGSIERRKGNEIECTPGLLLYYNTQEPHKNEKYLAGSKNFNIEFQHSWFENMHIKKNILEGGMIIKEPVIKSLFLNIMAEAMEPGSETHLSIEASVLKCFSVLKNKNKNYVSAPAWLIRLKELLAETENHHYSLAELSVLFGVHPVTISKLFPHFFHCTIGEYIRKTRIEKSLSLLSKKYIPLASISSACGFADHGHFTRVFKKHTGFTPSRYREILLR